MVCDVNTAGSVLFDPSRQRDVLCARMGMDLERPIPVWPEPDKCPCDPTSRPVQTVLFRGASASEPPGGPICLSFVNKLYGMPRLDPNTSALTCPATAANSRKDAIGARVSRSQLEPE